MKNIRIETDSFGKLNVSNDKYWGAQTQRSLKNFNIGEEKQKLSLIHGLIVIKQAAAIVNMEEGKLDRKIGNAIVKACKKIRTGKYDDNFPLSVWQTGSGTQTNMNVNEVIANVAIKSLNGKIGSKNPVHPNDHVNMSQSSNDTFPTAIHIAIAQTCHKNTIPGLQSLLESLKQKKKQFEQIIKIGRTHTQDATPLTLGQEFSGYCFQIEQAINRIINALDDIYFLAQGGTAVGTGINAHKRFAKVFAQEISKLSGNKYRSVASDNFFHELSSQDTAVQLSGELKNLAVALMKISNDLRWMNSGPLAGLSEIELQALQPGSSIMPGKVNPVIPEAVTMVSADVIGNDVSITVAAQAGNYQLNVMLPVIAYNLLKSINLLSGACDVLANKAIKTFKVNKKNLESSLAKNPILVTALNPIIGYKKAAAIAKKAYKENRPIIDVAAEETNLSVARLKKLLDPAKLAKGGIQ